MEVFNEGLSIMSATLVGKSSKTTVHGSMRIDFFRKSECQLQLSNVSTQRYIEKVTKAGLSSDPYCLENS